MSVNPGLFADLGKEAKEALFKSKDFNTKDQISYTTTSASGVKVIGKLTREEAKTAGQLEFKFPKHAATGLEGSALFDNKGKTKVSFSSADRFVPGLKMTLGAEIISNDEPKRDLFFTSEYKREHLTNSSKFTVPVTPSGPNFGSVSVLSGTVVGLEAQGVAGGVEVDYNIGTNALAGLHVVGQYKNKNFTLLGYSKQTHGTKPSHLCGAIYHMQVPTAVFSKGEVAGEFEYDNLKSSDNSTVSLAAGFDLSESTRLNTKADSKGKTTVIFTHNLNKNAKVRLGGEIGADTLSISKTFLELSFCD